MEIPTFWISPLDIGVLNHTQFSRCIKIPSPQVRSALLFAITKAFAHQQWQVIWLAVNANTGAIKLEHCAAVAADPIKSVSWEGFLARRRPRQTMALSLFHNSLMRRLRRTSRLWAALPTFVSHLQFLSLLTGGCIVRASAEGAKSEKQKRKRKAAFFSPFSATMAAPAAAPYDHHPIYIYLFPLDWRGKMRSGRYEKSKFSSL
jgi:hypothetical protein